MASMIKTLITTIYALNGLHLPKEILTTSIDAGLLRLRNTADPAPLTYSAAASHTTAYNTHPSPTEPRSSTPVETTPPKTQKTQSNVRMRHVPDDLEQFIAALDELPTLDDSETFPPMPCPRSNPRDPRLKSSTHNG